MKSKHAALWLAVAVLAVFAMAASSPQCARSTDEVVSPGLETLNTPDPVKVCQRDCDATRRVAIREERKRHRLASRACNGDMTCQTEEEMLHQSILAEIDSDHAACLIACEHNQGAGSGGQ